MVREKKEGYSVDAKSKGKKKSKRGKKSSNKETKGKQKQGNQSQTINVYVGKGERGGGGGKGRGGGGYSRSIPPVTSLNKQPPVVVNNPAPAPPPPNNYATDVMRDLTKKMGELTLMVNKSQIDHDVTMLSEGHTKARGMANPLREGVAESPLRPSAPPVEPAVSMSVDDDFLPPDVREERREGKKPAEPPAPIGVVKTAAKAGAKVVKNLAKDFVKDFVKEAFTYDETAAGTSSPSPAAPAPVNHPSAMVVAGQSPLDPTSAPVTMLVPYTDPLAPVSLGKRKALNPFEPVEDSVVLPTGRTAKKERSEQEERPAGSLEPSIQRLNTAEKVIAAYSTMRTSDDYMVISQSYARLSSPHQSRVLTHLKYVLAREGLLDDPGRRHTFTKLHKIYRDNLSNP